MQRWQRVISLSAGVLALVVLAGCRSRTDPRREIALAPPSALPARVRSAPPVVLEAYRFALANRELLSAIPCYCGCGSMGHTSNLSCYVTEFRTDGSVEFDDHAFGCGLCVDITRDVMRMVREGKTLQQMQYWIDAHYSRYGPGTSRIRLR